MKKEVGWFWFGLLFTLMVAGCQSNQRADLLLRNVNVIDVENGSVLEDQSVYISGNRIAKINSSSGSPSPETTRVVDAGGKYLIPGLWDMHFHFYGGDPERLSKLSLALGITGIRDLGATREIFDQIILYRKQIRKGKKSGPRIYAAGIIIDGDPPTRPHYMTAVNREQAIQAVDTLVKMGADFIKVYDRLPEEAYYAIAEECKRRELEFSGHLPDVISPTEASLAGQKSIEHLDDITNSVSELDTTFNTNGLSDYFKSQALNLNYYSEEKAASLYKQFSTNSTYQVPTLNTRYVQAKSTKQDLQSGILKRFVTEHQKSFLVEDLSDQTRSNILKVYKGWLKITADMHQYDVPLMAGSHAPEAFILAGFGLHQELQRIAEAGLSNHEVLKTATITPARYLGRSDELGTVEEGKLADLVLLDGNPLEDIHNTQEIRAVIVDGNLLEREKLDEMLREIEVKSN